MSNIETDKAVDDAKSQSTPGQMLGRARHAQGLSHADVAKKLYLSQFLIKQIEADQYEHFSAAVYLRGYLRSYAHLVGIPEEKVLAALEDMGYKKENEVDLNERLIKKVGKPIAFANDTQQLRQKRNVMPWVSCIVVAILIGLIVLWWQDQDKMANITLPTISDNNTPIVTKKKQQQKPAPLATEQKKQLEKKNILPTVNTTAKVRQSSQSRTKKRTALSPNYTLEPVQD